MTAIHPGITITPCDQFKPITIRENLVVNYKVWYICKVENVNTVKFHLYVKKTGKAWSDSAIMKTVDC